MVWLNKEIALYMTCHSFPTLKASFQVDLGVERDIKERASYKFIGYSSTNPWSNNRKLTQASTRWNKGKEGHKSVLSQETYGKDYSKISAKN